MRGSFLLRLGFQGLKHGNQGTHLESLRSLRVLLCREETSIEEILEFGFLRQLAHVLTSGFDFTAIFEALWCLTNIASGSHEQVRLVWTPLK